jgi:hypothetical protein
MVDLEISSDNMVTLLAHKARTGSRVDIAPTSAPIPHLPPIAFTFWAHRFPRNGVAVRFGQ